LKTDKFRARHAGKLALFDAADSSLW